MRLRFAAGLSQGLVQIIVGLCVLLLVPSPGPLIASAAPILAAQAPMSNPTPQQAIARLFTEPFQRDWFAPAFLQHVPPQQIQAVLTQMVEPLGDYQAVRQTDDGFEVRFSGGSVPTQIRLNAEGQIAELLFQPPSVPMALEEAIAAMRASPLETSLLVIEDGAALAAVNADAPLAVGSTFKIAVLAALKQQVGAGQQGWDAVVALRPEWKSLSSGMLQDWPSGARLTLETLAALMISISDNTATDALIDVVGREAIEALAPHNRPFLTTKEAFILKNPANSAWLERYRRGDEAARRQVVGELGSRPLPGKSLFSGVPVALDVEWFFTARELCGLMSAVADLPLMQINPGVARPADWGTVSFKGGSELGVLNLTTQLRTSAGKTYCVSATWNSKTAALDEAALTRFYESVIAGLK
ncbi:MAG: serine hydrolase [Elainellaceae cyanobacterium]